MTPRSEQHNGHRPERAQRQHRSETRPDRHERSSRPGDSTSIYVANLPWEAEEDDLQGLFQAHGDVHQVTIIMDRRTGRSKGFAFVDMATDAAEQAIAALNGAEMDGRDLTVRIALPRKY